MSSCCDGTHRAAMNRFSSDFILLFSWRASCFHRGTMEVIVLRWNAQLKKKLNLLMKAWFG
jgi:hypothetical protein